MPAAGNLVEAAGFASENLFNRWVASTLQARMIAFAAAVEDVVPDSNANSRPLGNWVAIIAAFAPTIASFSSAVVAGSATTYRESVSYIYRMFKLADALNTQGLITAAQRVALLAAYNAQFAA